MALDEESGYSPQAKVNNVYYFFITLILINIVYIESSYLIIKLEQ